MIDTSKIVMKVTPPKELTNNCHVQVFIPVSDEVQASDILLYLSGHTFRADFSREWMSKHAPTFGATLYGGPQPVLKKEGDRDSGIKGYKQTLTLCGMI